MIHVCKNPIHTHTHTRILTPEDGQSTCLKRRVYSPAPALQLYSPTQLSNSIQSSTQTSHPAYNFLVYSPFQDYTHFRKILFLPTSTFSPFHLTSIFFLLSLVLRGLYTWCTVNLFRDYHVDSLRERNSPSIVITRKLWNFWHEAFNQNFHSDDVIKMKNGYY